MNPYEVLQVHQSATDIQIDQALDDARIKFKDDPEKLLEAHMSHHILKDEFSRKVLDEYKAIKEIERPVQPVNHYHVYNHAPDKPEITLNYKLQTLFAFGILILIFAYFASL